jgi:hypothetical protein
VKEVVYNIGARIGAGPAAGAGPTTPGRRRFAPPPSGGPGGGGPSNSGGPSGSSGSGPSGSGYSGMASGSGSAGSPPPYRTAANNGDVPGVEELANMAGTSLRFGGKVVTPTKRREYIYFYLIYYIQVIYCFNVCCIGEPSPTWDIEEKDDNVQMEGGDNEMLEPEAENENNEAIEDPSPPTQPFSVSSRGRQIRRRLN